ncbi:MAG: ATP phosphoribosyltransferase [Clostridia bacterium]|nr:ATP phosphoribosyltransferase [Clostridia bacterium]
MEKYINIALPKGRLGEKVYNLLERLGYGCPSLLENSRKLVFEDEKNGVRYFWVKPSDVAIYVETGVADVGVVGKDILLEQNPDVYELIDLGFGKCRMAVAGKKGEFLPLDKTIKVATKFPNIAKKHFSSKSREIDIIKLNGSIELAPILGMSDVIVDIVETGSTLRENDLEVYEDIVDISARFIANKTSFRFKTEQIELMKSKIEKELM